MQRQGGDAAAGALADAAKLLKDLLGLLRLPNHKPTECREHQIRALLEQLEMARRQQQGRTGLVAVGAARPMSRPEQLQLLQQACEVSFEALALSCGNRQPPYQSAFQQRLWQQAMLLVYAWRDLYHRQHQRAAHTHEQHVQLQGEHQVLKGHLRALKGTVQAMLVDMSALLQHTTASRACSATPVSSGAACGSFGGGGGGDDCSQSGSSSSSHDNDNGSVFGEQQAAPLDPVSEATLAAAMAAAAGGAGGGLQAGRSSGAIVHSLISSIERMGQQFADCQKLACRLGGSQAAAQATGQPAGAGGRGGGEQKLQQLQRRQGQLAAVPPATSGDSGSSCRGGQPVSIGGDSVGSAGSRASCASSSALSCRPPPVLPRDAGAGARPPGRLAGPGGRAAHSVVAPAGARAHAAAAASAGAGGPRAEAAATVDAWRSHPTGHGGGPASAGRATTMAWFMQHAGGEPGDLEAARPQRRDAELRGAAAGVAAARARQEAGGGSPTAAAARELAAAPTQEAPCGDASSAAEEAPELSQEPSVSGWCSGGADAAAQEEEEEQQQQQPEEVRDDVCNTAAQRLPPPSGHQLAAQAGGPSAEESTAAEGPPNHWSLQQQQQQVAAASLALEQRLGRLAGRPAATKAAAAATAENSAEPGGTGPLTVALHKQPPRPSCAHVPPTQGAASEGATRAPSGAAQGAEGTSDQATAASGQRQQQRRQQQQHPPTQAAAPAAASAPACRAASHTAAAAAAAASRPGAAAPREPGESAAAACGPVRAGTPHCQGCSAQDASSNSGSPRFSEDMVLRGSCNTGCWCDRPSPRSPEGAHVTSGGADAADSPANTQPQQRQKGQAASSQGGSSDEARPLQGGGAPASGASLQAAGAGGGASERNSAPWSSPDSVTGVEDAQGRPAAAVPSAGKEPEAEGPRQSGELRDAVKDGKRSDSPSKRARGRAPATGAEPAAAHEGTGGTDGAPPGDPDGLAGAAVSDRAGAHGSEGKQRPAGCVGQQQAAPDGPAARRPKARQDGASVGQETKQQPKHGAQPGTQQPADSDSRHALHDQQAPAESCTATERQREDQRDQAPKQPQQDEQQGAAAPAGAAPPAPMVPAPGPPAPAPGPLDAETSESRLRYPAAGRASPAMLVAAGSGAGSRFSLQELLAVVVDLLSSKREHNQRCAAAGLPCSPPAAFVEQYVANKVHGDPPTFRGAMEALLAGLDQHKQHQPECALLCRVLATEVNEQYFDRHLAARERLQQLACDALLEQHRGQQQKQQQQQQQAPPPSSWEAGFKEILADRHVDGMLRAWAEQRPALLGRPEAPPGPLELERLQQEWWAGINHICGCANGGRRAGCVVSALLLVELQHQVAQLRPIAEAFRAADRERRGALDLQRFRVFCRQLNDEMPDDEVALLFTEELDPAGHGAVDFNAVSGCLLNVM